MPVWAKADVRFQFWFGFTAVERTGTSFGCFAYARIRFLGFSFGWSLIQASCFTLNTDDWSALLLGAFALLGCSGRQSFSYSGPVWKWIFFVDRPLKNHKCYTVAIKQVGFTKLGFTKMAKFFTLRCGANSVKCFKFKAFNVKTQTHRLRTSLMFADHCFITMISSSSYDQLSGATASEVVGLGFI